MHGSHCICARYVSRAIAKLKCSKSDGSTDIMSDHILNGGDKLSVYIGLLFTAMLRHGMTPDGMLTGTMVPIPKGRWANLNSSDNFRAITLSSLFGKILDTIILCKVKDNLCTSDFNFVLRRVLRHHFVLLSFRKLSLILSIMGVMFILYCWI